MENGLDTNYLVKALEQSLQIQQQNEQEEEIEELEEDFQMTME